MIAEFVLAYRGKGGWFEQIGIGSSNARHGIGATIVAASLALSPLHFAALFLAWILFTKPNIGTGFYCLNGNWEFTQEIKQKRSKFDVGCRAADWISSRMIAAQFSIKQAALAWMTIRQLYIIPFILLSGAYMQIVGAIFLGSIYYLSGALRKFHNLDEVAVAEIFTGIYLGILINAGTNFF